MTETNILLRHILATIAYRLTKVIDKADLNFLRFEPTHGVRKPLEIVSHLSSVLSYCLAGIEEKEPVKPVAVKAEEELQRFFNLLKATDEALENKPVALELALQLIQGPLADILTHVGQIAMLRRYYNKPVSAENFMTAKIRIGDIDGKSPEILKQESE